MPEPNNSAEIDKDKLWGWWYAAKQWQNKLHKSAAHKALDIPEEEMGGIQANKEMVVNNSGLHPAWLLAAAALGVGGYVYSQSGEQPAQPPAAVSTSQTDEQIKKEIIERQLKLRLYHNGKEVIAVPKAQ